MNERNNEENIPSTSRNTKTSSGGNIDQKRSIPHFFQNLANSSKNMKGLNEKRVTKEEEPITLDMSKTVCDLSKANSHSNSLSNFSLLASARLRNKNPRTAAMKEITPKVLNTSIDANGPNPEDDSEGNSHVLNPNHSNNANRNLTLHDLEVISPQSRTHRQIDFPNDSSQSHLFNQNRSNNLIVNNQNPEVANNDLNAQPQLSHNQAEPPQAPEPNNTQAVPNENNLPEITSEKADDWQHELTIKSNHKFGIAQWSLIFITLAALMAYASLSGQTPVNVLYIILLLNNLLHIYSILRFWNKKLLLSRKGLNKILKLCDWIILTVYCFGSLLKGQNKNMILTLYLTPVPIIALIRLKYFKKNTSYFRVVLWIQLLILSLRVDRIIVCDWGFVFIVAYGLCVMFISRMVSLTYMIKEKKQLRDELPGDIYSRLIRLRIFGLGWDLLLTSYSILFVPFFIGLTQRLNTGKNSILLGVTLILMMVYSIILIYISLKYKYEITRSLITKIIKNDKNHTKIREILQKELEVGISIKANPKYLVKVSSTYYQVAKPELKEGGTKIHKKIANKFAFITVGDLVGDNKDDELERQKNKKEEKEEDKQNREPEDVEGEEQLEEENQEDGSDREQEENEAQENDEQSESFVANKSKTKKANINREMRNKNNSEADAQKDSNEDNVSENDEKSNEEAQEDINCVICCDKKANAVIMNCGHGGICYSCGVELWKKEEKCYLCRQNITKLLRLKNSYDDDEDVVKVHIGTTLNKNRKININESFQDILNEI